MPTAFQRARARRIEREAESPKPGPGWKYNTKEGRWYSTDGDTQIFVTTPHQPRRPADAVSPPTPPTPPSSELGRMFGKLEVSGDDSNFNIVEERNRQKRAARSAEKRRKQRQRYLNDLRTKNPARHMRFWPGFT